MTPDVFVPEINETHHIVRLKCKHAIIVAIKIYESTLELYIAHTPHVRLTADPSAHRWDQQYVDDLYQASCAHEQIIAGMVNHGYDDGQQKDDIRDAHGPCQTIRSTF